MDRLTTDNPQNNFETVLNMVYGNDGWGYIRHDGRNILIQEFVLNLCHSHGCAISSDARLRMNLEEQDQFLCDCAFEGCPYATVYAALCGYCHTRSRLKMYEDAGMWPPQGRPLQKPLSREQFNEIHSMRDEHVWPFDAEPPMLFLESAIEKLDFCWISWEAADLLMDGFRAYSADNYGEKWRCWRCKPTEEERAAAPWEGVGDADL